jgi:DNA-binding NtrC family response regulator
VVAPGLPFKVAMSQQASLQPRFNETPPPPASQTQLVDAAVAELAFIEADWPTLSLLSRRYIDRALAHTAGNKTRAAELLGIDRRTLNRIMVRDRVRRPRP